MREYHTFIDRNYLIYKAVLSEKIEIEEEIPFKVAITVLNITKLVKL